MDAVTHIKFITFCLTIFIFHRARCSYVVRAFTHDAMDRWIDPLLDGAYKITLAANRKEKPMWQQQVSSLAI